jgi:hypothetical protein
MQTGEEELEVLGVRVNTTCAVEPYDVDSLRVGCG